ncbi:hypothetical protein ABRT01_08680 [Lentibacillus sp. L22]|uniref:hypothetical protein n=1 Tax=Lentibacillus TaxID=175304 RepID=UPI0022B154FC|nr:hypothetical protein [Lentibacillus daqui]
MKRKIVIAICLIFTIFMAFLAVYYFNSGEMKKALVGVGGAVCGAIPLLLALFFKLKFHLPLVISYLVFLFGSQYLGTIREWYGLGWWDTFIHFISGGVLAFTAIALYERLIRRNAGNAISPWFVFLFILGFSALGGVLWEIYEFTCDQLFQTTMQGGGNFDTMTDLIAGMISSLIIAGYAGIRTKVKLKRKRQSIPTNHK